MMCSLSAVDILGMPGTLYSVCSEHSDSAKESQARPTHRVREGTNRCEASSGLLARCATVRRRAMDPSKTLSTRTTTRSKDHLRLSVTWFSIVSRRHA